jgi:hypothetical protein
MRPAFWTAKIDRLRTTGTQGTKFLAEPRNANITVVLVMLLAAMAGGVLGILLAILDTHDSTIAWLICTG